MTCPTCHKPTPSDSVHTDSPVPLLTAEVAAEWVKYWIGPSDADKEFLKAIATGRVACHDTQAGVFVPYMSEAQAREKWRGTMLPSLSPADSIKSGYQHFQGYLAALRDIGAIK